MKTMNARTTFVAASCLALNLSLAKAAAVLSLPVYLDCVGTILAAALLPWWMAIVVAVGTSLLGGIVINPYFAAYAGTQLVIALVSLLAFRWNLFAKWWTAILAGFLIAIAAVFASAPVTAMLFGGVTLSGTTAINAILIASGQSIWKSVITGALFIESIDKPTAALLAWLTLRRLPANLRFKSTASSKDEIN